MPDLDIRLAPVPTPEVATLVGELNAEMGALYTAEQQHGLALDGIFQPHIRFFLAWLDGVPVGCGGVGFFDGFAELKRMYVRPEARGQGIADALVARLARESAAAGHDLLRLETGSRSLAVAQSDERRGIDRRGAGFRDRVAQAIDAPSPSADSPSDQRLRGVVGQANRDVRVAPGKIQRLVGQNEIDHDARILGLELSDDRRHEMLADRLRGGDGEVAGRLDVAARDPGSAFITILMV